MKMTYQKKLVQLGLNIAHYRKLRGYDQIQLAELAEVSRTTIGRIETATNAPSLETLCKICDVLDITEKDLFDFKQ